MDSRGLQSKRLQKEMAKLSKLPPMGVVCYVAGEGNDLRALEAKVNPPEGTPYEEGCFKLSVTCGDRYPNEPPNVRFVTPVYHPNIDSEGRICLNLLKMPPKGVWTPAYDIAAVLTAIQILLAQPNPDDPLMTDITEEYRANLDLFLRKAREHTQKYAVQAHESGAGQGSAVVAQKISSVGEPTLEPPKGKADALQTAPSAVATLQGIVRQSPDNDDGDVVAIIRPTFTEKRIRLF